jgi:hypothetical protein
MEGNDDVAPIKAAGIGGNGHGNLQIDSDPMNNGSADTLNGGNDKGIAHSPSDSMSSMDSAGSRPAGGRRMSNVSDEERDRARIYREGVMNKGGE